MKKSLLCLVFTLLFSCFNSEGQSLSKTEITKATESYFVESISNLQQFLRLENDGNYPEQILKNKHWCDSIFKQLNFKTTTLKTDGAPLLFAERIFNKKAKSVLFYLQIDGQPVDTTAWFQADPFEPVLKEKNEDKWDSIGFGNIYKKINPDWRIFARSSSDSKGPAISFISALQILESEKIKPKFNIKVIMDFQEELGSPNLPKAVEANKELLAAEMLFIMDGTRHISNLPTLTYGARGIATARLIIHGPRYGLHSGQYGNFAPNPVFEASRFIASLKDENGKVTIPNFYEGVYLTDDDKSRLNKIPEDMNQTLQTLGISKTDEVGNTYQEALQYPTLNVRGIKAAWVDKEVRTIIPSEVIIEFDMRLVPETPGERQIGLLKKHIEDYGYHLVDSLPSEEERKKHPKLASFSFRLGSAPFRTEIDSPIGFFLNRAMKKVFGDQVVNMRTTGGSQPMAPFIKTLNIPAVSIRIPNPDNSIHGPNENLRLGNLKEGIMSCLAILTEPIPN